MSEAQHSSKTPKSNAFRCLFALDLIPYKLFCFFLYGAYGSLLPYLPLYFKQLGIEAFEAGVIIGIRPMVQIIGAPFFGAVADRYRMGKVLLLGGVCGWILKSLLILAVRPHSQKCISLYDNTTANVTATYVNVKPLWDKETEGKHIWTLFTAENPIKVEKSKTILKYSSQEPQQVKHKAHGNSFLLYELNKRGFSDLSNDLNSNATRIVETGVLGKVSYGRFISRENSGLRAKKMPYPNEFLHPKHKKLYAAKTKRESQKETQKVIVWRNTENINLRRKQSSAEKHVTSLYPRQKKWQRFQSRLKEHGLTVTHIVNAFEPKLNKTLTYVTQIDTHEVYYMFVIFTLFIIVGEFLESPTYTLSDSSLLDRLGEDREYYGNIRMFGSLGWALTSLLVGYLVAATAFNLCEVPSGNYLVTFYIFIVCCSVAFFCVLGFTFKYDSKVKPSGPSCREVGQLLLNLRFSSFLVSVLFLGWCYGFLIHFVNWFIDDLNGSPVIMGVAGAARELTGLAFFFIGGSVISVLGHINTMVLCLLAYMALFYCYSVVINPWFVVGLEMMAGANYALAWSTCVNYTNRVGSALGVTATVQGLLQAVFWGFGNGGGSVLSGALYHYLGPITTFQIFTVASGITVLYLIITCKISEKLKVPDLTNMEALCDMTAERVKPSRDADNHASLDTSENESLEDEPFLFLYKRKK